MEEKIVAEISGIVKEREEIKNGELIFKAEEIKKMDYLQAALSEALRLCPSVPVDLKEVILFPESGTPCLLHTQFFLKLYALTIFL